MQNRGEFRVAVTKDYLVFASAHFITFAGHRCESLHGHNYRVGVVLEGALDEESWYVFDFGALKKIMRRLCDEIDHKGLLPLAAALTTPPRTRSASPAGARRATTRSSFPSRTRACRWPRPATP